MCLPSYLIQVSVRHGRQRAPEPNLTQHRVILLAIDLGIAACVCLATAFQRLLGMAACVCLATAFKRLLGMAARGRPNLTLPSIE